MATFLGKLLGSKRMMPTDVVGIEVSFSPRTERVAFACMLDGCGIDPDNLVPFGVQIMEIADEDAFKPSDDFFDDLKIGNIPLTNAGPDDLVVCTLGSRLQSDMNVITCRGRVLMLTNDSTMASPTMLEVVSHVIKVDWTSDGLARFARWRYRHDDLVAGDFDFKAVHLTMKEVLVAARINATRQGFADRLLEICDGRRTELYASLTDDHGDVDTAMPLAKAAAGVVKKLSQMSGFGDAKAWGIQLAEDLRAYKKGELAWSDMDKGMLLSSPPGGGKTTYARALAAECDVPLVVSGYADIMTADNGTGDSASKALVKTFTKWRKQAESGPFIVFYDEADSMGARGMNDHNESWFAAQINAWLAFLDGATPRDGIVVIFATNYPDRVDPALRRPGRLDRHVEIPLPGIADLAGMVAYHMGGSPKSADMREAAVALRGSNPSHVEQVCRDTRRMGRLLKRRVDGSDVADMVRMRMPIVPADVDRATAIHEAGHVVACRHFGYRMASVDIGREQNAQYEKPNHLGSLQNYRDVITMMLSGRAAEDVVMGVVTSGATRDLQMATTLGKDVMFRFGLGKRLTYQDTIRQPELEEVDVLLHGIYAEAKALIERKRPAVEWLAKDLLSARYMDRQEIDASLKAHRMTFMKTSSLWTEEATEERWMPSLAA